MFKIGLYGTVEERKQMEEVLSQYFKEYKIKFQFNQTYDSAQFITDSLFKGFNLYMICINKKISYMLKIYDNFDLQTSRYISGSIKFPLTYDDIIKMSIKKHPLTGTCPYGIYLLRKRGDIHKILHEEIEYIRREKRKSVIHLNNRDTEDIAKSLVQVERELDKEYFVKCSKGYLVNIFNVDKLNEEYNSLRLKSGAEIPLSRAGRKNFFKALILAQTGTNIFTY